MKPQRTQSKTYIVITACREKLFISSFISLCSLWLILFSLSGCATTKGTNQPPAEQTEAAAVASEKPQAQGEIKADLEEPKKIQRVQEMSFPDFTRAPAPKLLPPKIEKEPIDAKKIAHAEGNVIINAEAMPLSDFVIYALGDTLKITFFIDEQVKNMKNLVTLRMTQEMPADKVTDIVIGFLEKQDLAVEEKGGALYITKPKPPAPKPPLDIRVGRNVPDSPAPILQVVPFKYIRYADIDYIIRQIYKTPVDIWPYARENVLLISGPASAVKEAVDIIDLFDIPYISNKKLMMLKLVYWQTDEFVKQITAILQGLNFPVSGSMKDPGIIFMPIKFLNSVLVIAPDEESMKYTMDWYKKLDTDESAGSNEKAFTYIPKFSKASDLVDALSRLYMGAAPVAPGQPAAPTAPTGTAFQAGPAPPAPSAAFPATRPAGPSGAQGGPQTQSSFASASGLKVAADDKRNIILIRAVPAEYRNLLNYLDKLDVLPKQVLIEATIAELTLTDDLNYGLEWYLKNKTKNNLTGAGVSTVQTLGNLGVETSPQGLAYKFLANSSNIQVVMNAFAQENKVNIISTPRLMVLDNESASIQIGSDVPLLSGSTTSTSAATEVTVATQAVQYRSTGLMVSVKPTINTEGVLTLSISVESSNAESNNVSSVSSPIITERRLETIVVASSGQTIILGGLMQDNISDTYTKVPLLGDIPLIGNLFKNTSKGKTKTELIVLLTPTILTTTDDAARITSDIKQQIRLVK
jgi:general secretion pathway protein D